MVGVLTNLTIQVAVADVVEDARRAMKQSGVDGVGQEKISKLCRGAAGLICCHGDAPRFSLSESWGSAIASQAKRHTTWPEHEIGTGGELVQAHELPVRAYQGPLRMRIGILFNERRGFRGHFGGVML
jgi:hypothetical protein